MIVGTVGELDVGSTPPDSSAILTSVFGSENPRIARKLRQYGVDALRFEASVGAGRGTLARYLFSHCAAASAGVARGTTTSAAESPPMAPAAGVLVPKPVPLGPDCMHNAFPLEVDNCCSRVVMCVATCSADLWMGEFKADAGARFGQPDSVEGDLP